MAKKNTILDFVKKALKREETKAVKGGRSYVPTNTGSYGFVNWDDVTVRDSGVVSNQKEILRGDR